MLKPDSKIGIRRTDAVALTLKSGRKVYIMPEQSYDNITRFVIQNTSVKVLH